MDGWEGRRRISPRRRSFRTIALLMLTPVVGLLAILVGIFVVQSRPVLSSRLSVLSSRHPRRTENRERRTRARIVLIIDDVGFGRRPLDAAMRIDPNRKFSILHYARHPLDDAERF